MTRLVREKILTGNYFELPEWMTSYTTHFGNFYQHALFNFVVGNMNNVPRSWRLVFDQARKGDMTIYINFAVGINAHIVGDLGIAVSELDPVGVNRTAKKADSQKINGIIHNCSLALETALVDFYTPVINMTNWKTLFNVVLNKLTDVLRNVSWKEGMFIAIHPTAKKTLQYIMDNNAWLIGETRVALSPLFEALRKYERSFPFEHFCKIVPWGCGDNNE